MEALLAACVDAPSALSRSEEIDGSEQRGALSSTGGDSGACERKADAEGKKEPGSKAGGLYLDLTVMAGSAPGWEMRLARSMVSRGNG